MSCMVDIDGRACCSLTKRALLSIGQALQELAENRQGRREERSASERLEEDCRRMRREAQETALEMDARSRRERRQLADLTKVIYSVIALKSSWSQHPQSHPVKLPTH